MLKIGEFSQISRVTVKALRHYDEIGLLPAAHVDEESSYRYYTVEQLPRLHRILALKDLGFSLDEIARALDEGVSLERLRSMMERRKAEIRDRIREERERMTLLEVRLKQIEREGRMSGYEVIVKQVDEAWVASIREKLSSYSAIGALYKELYKTMGITMAVRGCGAVWHDPEYKETDVDGEAIVFLSRQVKPRGRAQVKELSGGTFAVVVHKGAYATLSQAYEAIVPWIQQNGYAITGPSREVYLKGPKKPGEQHDEGCLTEIQFPVEKVHGE